jgi:hypothetical protein
MLVNKKGGEGPWRSSPQWYIVARMIDGFWSVLKRGVVVTYHEVSKN